MTPLGHIGLTPLHVFDVLVHVLYYIYSGTLHAATLILLSSSPLQSLTNERTKWARDVINLGKLPRDWLVNYYQQGKVFLIYPWTPDILIKFLT